MSQDLPRLRLFKKEWVGCCKKCFGTYGLSRSWILQPAVSSAEGIEGVVFHDQLIELECLSHLSQIQDGDGLFGVGGRSGRSNFMFSLYLKDTYFQVTIHLDTDLISGLQSEARPTSPVFYVSVFLQPPRSLPECFLWFQSWLTRVECNFCVIQSLSSEDPAKPVPPSNECKQCIGWWLQEERWASGIPFQVPLPLLFLYTDMLMTNWGTHLQDLTAEEVWSLEETAFHINVLKMKAVHLTVNSFFLRIFEGLVILMSDNITVVAIWESKEALFPG